MLLRVSRPDPALSLVVLVLSLVRRVPNVIFCDQGRGKASLAPLLSGACTCLLRSVQPAASSCVQTADPGAPVSLQQSVSMAQQLW